MKFYKTIEEMPWEELVTRVKEAMEVKLESSIAIMPFVGELTETVSYTYDELTALCPMTGQPDFYTITITYTPAQLLAELKSLAIYFRAFRNIPIGHEHLFARIWKDFKNIVQPLELKIKLEVAVRGGIRTCIEKEEKHC